MRVYNPMGLGEFILILDEEEGEGFLVWIEMKKFKVQKQKEF